jgi:hypothetical protein
MSNKQEMGWCLLLVLLGLAAAKLGVWWIAAAALGLTAIGLFGKLK